MLTIVRACLPILIVISLATFACMGGTSSDYPNAIDDPPGGGGPPKVDPGGEHEPGNGGGTGVMDAGASSELDAAAPSMDPCALPADAGDASLPDGGGVDGQIELGDSATEAGDASDAAQTSDAQVDNDANFPDSGVVQLVPSDASSDAPHSAAEGGTCVQ